MITPLHLHDYFSLSVYTAENGAEASRVSQEKGEERDTAVISPASGDLKLYNPQKVFLLPRLGRFGAAVRVSDAVDEL